MLDKEILDDFVAETFELLDEVEPQLIELAQSADVSCVDAETLNAVFRLFHTMKGGAGFLGLNSVSSVTHVAETLLDLFRKGKGTFDAKHVQVLCETIDFVRELLSRTSATGADAGYEVQGESITRRLQELIAGLSGRACQAEEPEKEPGSGIPSDISDQEPIILDFGDEPADTAPRSDQPQGDPTSAPQHTGDDTAFLAMTPALRQSFVQEAQEYLEQAEQALLGIEKAPDGELGSILNASFRALHSLKGNCGFLGFPDMEQLAHRMENALGAMREGTISADAAKTGMLLKMLDVLRIAVQAVGQGESGAIDNHELYLDLLDDTMGLPAGPAPIPPSATKPASLSALEPTPAAPHFPASSPVQAPARPAAPAPSPAAPVSAPAKQTDKQSKSQQQTIPKAHQANPPASRQPDNRKEVRQEVCQDVRQDIRVDIRKLDALINLVGELVIAEAMVTRHPHMLAAESETLERATHLLRRVSRDLQDVIMSARMIPLSATFRKMIRLVHDLSKKSGKRINLKLLGEDTEVDKTLIEQIADPLVHIVRNAGDHGIEPPEQRATSGKPEEATITIEGRHEGGEVWILISDDGRGLNRERILAKAREKDLVGSEAEDWEDQRIFRLIFHPGFSTAAQVTDVSGRGVGMDVVKRNIEKLKGKIDIRSHPGQGSTFILRIPLTLAIIDGMLVRVGAARYTIPMLAIRESVRPQPSWITVTPDGQETVRIRDDFFPILRLHERFNKEPDSRDFGDGILVLVDCDRQTIALFVDEILGQQETVIKGLSNLLSHSPGISGCTILGDGEVSLILDIPGLVEESGGRR